MSGIGPLPDRPTARTLQGTPLPSAAAETLPMNLPTTPAIVALAAALSLAVPPEASAQARLFSLHSTGQLAEVLQYRSVNASLAPISTLPLAPGEVPRGLAFDPLSGDFFTLTLNGSVARIARFDPSNGQASTICTLTAPLADGLDRRSDGILVLTESLSTLVLIDPATCDVTRTSATMPIGVHTSEGSVAWDRRGLVAALGGDGTSQRLDSLDGSSLAFGAAMFAGSRALEIDLDGRFYFGQYDGALFWSDGQVGQSLPSGPAFAGLAFSIPADGEGMSIACSGSANSTGQSATIEALGSAAVLDGDLELRCRRLPPNTFGIFIVGAHPGTTPLGSGVLCIGAPQQRYNQSLQNSGAQGQARFQVNLTALPNGNPFAAGSTYYFQYWHRDAPATSNLSAAIRVDFR